MDTLFKENSEAIGRCGREVMAEARLRALEARSERDGRAALYLETRRANGSVGVRSLMVRRSQGRYLYSEWAWDDGGMVNRRKALELIFELAT